MKLEIFIHISGIYIHVIIFSSKRIFYTDYLYIKKKKNSTKMKDVEILYHSVGVTDFLHFWPLPME